MEWYFANDMTLCWNSFFGLIRSLNKIIWQERVSKPHFVVNFCLTLPSLRILVPFHNFQLNICNCLILIYHRSCMYCIVYRNCHTTFLKASFKTNCEVCPMVRFMSTDFFPKILSSSKFKSAKNQKSRMLLFEIGV